MSKFILALLFVFIQNAMWAQVGFLQEDFNSCNANLPNGWTSSSVVGNDEWSCNSSGYNGNGVSMNGFNNNTYSANEDWLISPQLNLANISDVSLTFWSRTKFAGNPLQLYISNNYLGTGNPNLATWINLNALFPTINSDFWLITNGINLNPYKGTPCHIAFRYISTNSSAAFWRLDDIQINDIDIVVGKKFINAGDAAAGNYSNAQTFTFTKNTISGSLLIKCNSPFELSNDNVNFSNQISYSNSAGGLEQTVYVRINPNISNKVYRDKIWFEYNAITLAPTILVLGTSIPDDKSLRVCNWNILWFGDGINCNCDTSLSRKNAARIMKDIDADLYCLQEVVSVPQLEALKNELGDDYSYVVSPYGSFALNPLSQDYDEAQKLAYIYKTSKIQNAASYGLLASTYPTLSGSTSPYNCFSSGRYPFMMHAKVVLENGNLDTMYFANIHAKAGGGTSDYDRRKCAAEAMTDSLLTLFPSRKVAVVGDFNDYLEGTSVSSQSVSPYQYLLNQGYSGITLASLFPNQTTYVYSSDHIIDNVVVSPQAKNIYIDSSTFIFKEVLSYIPNFESTTSDHLPVVSFFSFDFPNSISTQRSIQNIDFTLVNPTHQELIFQFENIFRDATQIKVFDITGKILWSEIMILNKSRVNISLPNFSEGLYLIEVRQGNRVGYKKWLNQ
jgi:endonuclease/exonuclease/phosphatase family metal-dependent hydrolase